MRETTSWLCQLGVLGNVRQIVFPMKDCPSPGPIAIAFCWSILLFFGWEQRHAWYLTEISNLAKGPAGHESSPVFNKSKFACCRNISKKSCGTLKNCLVAKLFGAHHTDKGHDPVHSRWKPILLLSHSPSCHEKPVSAGYDTLQGKIPWFHGVGKDWK